MKVVPLTVSVPPPDKVVYPASPVIAVTPTLRVKVLERTPYVVAVPKDGKDSFFRKLELDQPTMKLIRNYRVLKQSLDRDPDAREVDK